MKSWSKWRRPSAFASFMETDRSPVRRVSLVFYVRFLRVSFSKGNTNQTHYRLSIALSMMNTVVIDGREWEGLMAGWVGGWVVLLICIIFSELAPMARLVGNGG